MTDDDLGRPIEELEQLVQEPAPDFLARLRKKIERRRVTGHFATFAWEVPAMLLIEFLDFVFQLFAAREDRRGDST